MRAFLAADSCPSRCRRSTSWLSWGGTGPSDQERASHPPKAIVQMRKLRFRKSRAGPRLRAKAPYAPDSGKVDCRCQTTAEGDYFQKGAHPTPGCTSLSLAGMRAPQVYICELGPLGEGNGVPAKSCVPEAAEGSTGKLPTATPQMREVGGDQQK